MDQSPNDLPEEETSEDDDLEILDRILKQEQSKWDEEEATGFDEPDEDDDFYIFEEEEVESQTPVLVEEPQRISKRFLVVRELFSDTRGTLFDVRDCDHDERPCLLRVLSPAWLGAAPVEDLLARAEQVRAASCELEHSALLPFDEIGLSEEGQFWITQQPPEGESLAKLMGRAGALPPAHALEIIQQLLAALEHADALGLQHGALSAETISLAAHQGWSQENPYAVGVRLSEVGLASMAPSGEEGQDDLFAAACLLAQLLTGEAFDSSASSWASSPAASKSMGLSEPLGVLLDTGLASEPGDRYQSPKDFRVALERVAEYRPKPTVRKRSALTNVLLLLVVCAVVYGTKERWWPAAKSQAQPAIPAASTDQAELDALRRANDLLIDEEKQRAAETAQKLADALAAQALLDSQSADERSMLEGNLEAERLAAEAAREAERQKSGQVDTLTANLEDSQARIQELENAARQRVRLAQEKTQAAALAQATGDINRMLRALQEGNLVNARQVGKELESNELLLAAPIQLMPFFLELFTAHDELAALDSRSNPFERQTLQASAGDALLRAVTSGKPAMTADNDSALLDDVERIASYQALLDSLGQRLDSHREQLRTEFEQLWTASLAAHDLPPSQVLRLAAVFEAPTERVQEFVRAYAARIEDEVLGYDVIEFEKLNAISSIDAWNTQLAKDPLQGLESEIQLLDSLGFALRFYGGGKLPQAPAHLLKPGESKVWLERLSLAAALVDTDSGMRGAIGSRLLYHTRTEKGEETWRWDTIQEDLSPPPGVDDSRLVLQEFHDAEGNKLGQRVLRLYRVGLHVYEGAARPLRLLNLTRSGPPYPIFAWHAADETQPPAKLRISPGAFQAFRKRLKEEPWRAFTVEEGRQISLWTRELGLVRHTIPGRISFELVYAELP